MTIGKKSFTISEVFNALNLLKFVLAILISLSVIWLNSRYASQDQLNDIKDKILLINDRVSIIEQKNIQTEKINLELVSTIKSIERRLGYLVTEDGRVLYDVKIINMERDISLMQKDIQYLRESEVNKNKSK